MWYLIFLSSCGWGYECAQEVFAHKTQAECFQQQEEYKRWRTICVKSEHKLKSKLQDKPTEGQTTTHEWLDGVYDGDISGLKSNKEQK